MAGIAGIIYPDILEVGQLISPMLQIMRHRGLSPLDSYTYREFQLGATGSSITSIKRGSIVVTLDGVLNKRYQLIQELAQFGYQLEKASDEELIAYAYASWGIDCLSFLQGRFAFALFDRLEESLYLVRDPLGKSPLYWFQGNQHILFASDLKALLTTGLIPQQIDSMAMGIYCLLGWVPQDMTLVQEVNRLLPGHYLKTSLKGSCSVHAYWSPPEEWKTELIPDCSGWQATLNKGIEEELEAKKSSSMRIACVLEGGFDEGVILNRLEYLLQEPIPSYKIHFQNEISAIPPQENSIVIRAADLVQNLLTIIWQTGEPLADVQSIATWKLMERCQADGVTHLYSSQGYSDFFRPLSPEPDFPYSGSGSLVPFSSAFNHYLMPLLQQLSPALTDTLKRVLCINSIPRHTFPGHLLMDGQALATLAPQLSSGMNWRFILKSFFSSPSELPKHYGHFFLEFCGRLPDSQLLQWGQAAAAHSIQWPTPFLCSSVLPLLPGMLLDFRKKRTTMHPFNHPWARHPLVYSALEHLSSGALVGAGLLNAKALQHLLRGARQTPSLIAPLWSLLQLEIWYRLFIHNPVRMRAPSISLEEYLSRE